MESKFKQIIPLVLLITMILAACSPAATPAPTFVSTQGAYPAPGLSNLAQTYPAPDQSTNVLIYNPYPGPSEGVTNFIDWPQAEQTILSGQVAKVYYASTQHVTLVLKDGSVALTMEPTFDEVLRVIERCGDACKGIEKITQ